MFVYHCLFFVGFLHPGTPVQICIFLEVEEQILNEIISVKQEELPTEHFFIKEF